MVARSESATLSLDRFVPEARSLVVGAQALADDRKHPQVVPLHLLSTALTRVPSVSEVFRRAGAEPGELVTGAERALAALPRSNEPAYLAPTLLDLLERAEREADRARQKEVRTEDLLNALSQELRGAVGELFATFNIGPGSLRPHVGVLGTTARAALPAPITTESTNREPKRSLIAQAKRESERQIVGRAAEVARLLTILERQTKCHPLLVGEPGVGKRAIVFALARRLALGQVPAGLSGAELFELDLPLLLAGARVRGELEERTRQLIAGLADGAEPHILSVFGLEQLFGSGVNAGAVSDLFRSAIERESLRLLGTTTPDGLRRIQERDPYFLRSMTILEIDEPSVADSIEIVKAVGQRLSAHHRITIEDDAVTAAVQLGKRYVQDRFLPDSAIDLLDEAAAQKRVLLDDPARRAEPSSAQSEPVESEATLGAEGVAATLAGWTGIPVQRMLEGEAEKLLNMEQRLAGRVVGQDHAVSAVARAVRRSRVGLRDPGRPIGSFLFLGPSGVGKTELAKALAQLLFDDEHALTRLDMSEFMERHMAQRLIGAPPGYADSDQGGFLTEAVRRRPYSVLLFDEVEKAHQDVFNLLLQVLDEGRLTDGRGRLADFSNTVVIMTSNIGSERILETEPRLFESDEGIEALRDVLLDRLREFFRPELLNRIDELLVFRPLSREHLRSVADIQLAHVEKLLQSKNVRLDVTDAAKTRLVELGYEPALGARPLKRTILRHVQDPLAQALLSGTFADGATVRVDVDGDQVVLRS